jgi:transcriptional regulator with XRE-family HTH domain
MSREFLKKLSDELKETREQKGFSLEQIYGRTRIDLKFLQAIESGHFDIMPDVYMKAFIKEYAAFIGLDADKTLRQYELAKNGQPYDESEIEEAEPEEGEIKEVPSSKVFDSASETTNSTPYTPSETKNNNLVIVVIGIVIIVIAAVYFLFLRGSSDEIIIETPYEEIIKDQTARFEEVEEPEEKVQVDENIDSFTLKINATDTSWVKLVIDNSRTLEYILNPNSTKSIEANSFIDITLGNSGGIILFLNEEPLDFKGTKGRVRNFRIDANGYSSISNN